MLMARWTECTNALPQALEICEHKYGFVPGVGEPGAGRVRRRFRLVKGGNPQLVLIWYSRAQVARTSSLSTILPMIRSHI
jgi:hypothetical protein